MRAAPLPGRVTLQPRVAAIQPATVQPTRRLLDRRLGTPSARHQSWLGRYQDWQWDAKRYARTVGVVRFAANIVASTAGRVNLIVEQRNADGDWEETEDADLRSMLALYGNETFGQTANELTRLHTWHYQVAGEAVMMHRDDTQGIPEWMIASMDAIEWNKPQTDLATIRFHPGGVVSDGTAVVLPRDQMLRYWMPDEEWLGLATSPMTSVMDDIRRYKSLVRYAQRQAESYLAMNGIIWTPEKAHASQASGDATDHEGDDPTESAEPNDTIFDLYNDWAQMSINDDDSIAAVVPPLVWWGEAGDEPKKIDVAGGLDEHGPEHRDEALRDFARGADSPASLLVSGGSNDDANHWSAAITQERFVAAVAPTLDRVTHQDMTVAFLYPLMRLAGRTDLRRTRIGYDPTPVIVHPDQSDKGLRGWLSGLVGSEPAREAMGFDPSDAPTPEDLKLLGEVLSNFAAASGGGAAPGGHAAPGSLPSIKTPGEKVGPGNQRVTAPEQPQPTGTGTPLARAADVIADVLGPYLPVMDAATPAGVFPGRTVNVGEIHIHEGNGHGDSRTRTAASLNAGMNGAMVALPVPPDVQSEALPDGEPADAMHMTLLYFGGVDELDPQMQATLKGICSAIASNSEMPLVDLSHMERFAPTPDGHSGPDLYPCCMVDDGPDVPDLVERLKAACDAAGTPYHDDHAFRSHVTLGYYPDGQGPESGPLPTSHQYAPDSLMLHWGDEVHAFPFVDAPGPGAPPPTGPVSASVPASRFARRAFFDEGKHPREHGRFTFSDNPEQAARAIGPQDSIAKMMSTLVDPDSGMTIGRDGDVPTTGYIVAVDGHSAAIPAETFTTDRTAAVDFVDQYLADNAETLDAEGMMLGLWHNPETGNVVFDAVEHVADREEALRLGAERDQIAIYGIGEGVIPVGGTGGAQAAARSPVEASEADRSDDAGGTPPVRGASSRSRLSKRPRRPR